MLFRSGIDFKFSKLLGDGKSRNDSVDVVGTEEDEIYTLVKYFLVLICVLRFWYVFKTLIFPC